MSSLVNRFIRRIRSALVSLDHASLQLTRPSCCSALLGFAFDISRSKAQLVAENALLRQQLVILHCQVDKPRFTPTDRLLLALLASRVWSWKEATTTGVMVSQVSPEQPRTGFSARTSCPSHQWHPQPRGRPLCGADNSPEFLWLADALMDLKSYSLAADDDVVCCGDLVGVGRRTLCNSSRNESLYSSNQRWRHRRESGKTKACG